MPLRASRQRERAARVVALVNAMNVIPNPVAMSAADKDSLLALLRAKHAERHALQIEEIRAALS